MYEKRNGLSALEKRKMTQSRNKKTHMNLVQWTILKTEFFWSEKQPTDNISKQLERID